MKSTIIETGEDTFLLCRGGRGGRGNRSFKNAKCQSPWMYEIGEKGEEKNIILKKSNCKRIGVVLIGFEQEYFSEILGEKLLKKDIECFYFPLSIFGKSEWKNMYTEALELCEFFLLCVEYPNKELDIQIKKIREEIEAKQLDCYLLGIGDGKKLKASENEIFFYLSKSEASQELIEKVHKTIENRGSCLPFFKPKVDVYSDYIEYSDELFPEKEPLKISKVKGGWEVNSQRLNYWCDRIPQTTLHNIERLKRKLNLLEIIKEIKKNGGVRGEKVWIHSFETELD